MENQQVEIETKDGVTEAFTLTTNNGCFINGAKTSRPQGIIREKISIKQKSNL